MKIKEDGFLYVFHLMLYFYALLNIILILCLATLPLLALTIGFIGFILYPIFHVYIIANSNNTKKASNNE